MKKYIALMLTVLLAIAALTACGGRDKDNGDASSSKVQVGIVLPGGDELRWMQDELTFQTTLGNAGISSEVMHSGGSTATELSNVDDLIDKGMKVLIICTEDVNAAGKAVLDARDAGAKVICYDRLVMGTDAIDYYVNFDSYEIGQAQGQYLIDSFAGEKNVPLYLYAGDASDGNSYALFAGAWSVLRKAVKKGQFEIRNCDAAVSFGTKKLDVVKDQATLDEIIKSISTGGSRDAASKLAKANLKSDKGKKKQVAVLAPDDASARGLADAFAANKKVKSYVVTGQNAEPASLKYIQKGKQSMTIGKDTSALALAACEMAKKLTGGDAPETNAECDNGVIEVPTYTAEFTLVDAESLPQLIEEGVYSQADIDAAK